MKLFTRMWLSLLCMMVAGVTNVYADDEVELSSDMFFTWDGYGADASSLSAATVDFNIGNELGAGAMVCGTSTVDYLTYADLTGSTKLIITGTAGMQLRVLMNRQESNSGPLVEKNPTIGEGGSVEVDLTDLAYVHLNAIKTGWGSASGTISSIKMVKPDDPLAMPKEALKKAINAGKVQSSFGKTAASFATLTDAISAGETALAAADATETSLTNAKTAIENAIAGLVLQDGFSVLTADMFKHYASLDAPGDGEAVGCSYEVGKASDLPYGDGSVGELNWADLTQYDKLYVVTAGEIKPRFCLNRLVKDGQQAETQADSKMLDINPNNGYTWSTDAYQTIDGNVYAIDLKQIVDDYTFARLHCIKKQGWGAGVFVNDMLLYKAPEAPASTKVTFNFADPNFREKIGTAMTDVDGYIYNETFTAEGATLQITAGSAPSRIYVDSNRGQNLVTYKEYTTLTFNAPEGKAITKIEFTAAGNSNINNFTASSGTIEGMTWTGNAEGVRFTQGGTSYLANAILTLVDKTGETAALPAIEYTKCANIAEFNALAAGTYAEVTLTDAEVIGKSADGYSTVWVQDATGGCWIQYTSLNDKLNEKTKINGTVFVVKRATSGNTQMKEAEATLNSQVESAAIEAYTVVEGTIEEVNIAANLNKVVKISGATLTMTSATAGKLTIGESSINVNNGNATANQALCKIAGWEKDKVLENIIIEAILVAASASTQQLLPISITIFTPVDCTAKVNTNGWQSDMGNVGNYTKDVDQKEQYLTNTTTLGKVLYQTVEGLDNGTYTVELYANASYTSGRGFASDALDGEVGRVAVYAGDVEKTIPVIFQTGVGENNIVTLENVVVRDGTLQMGLRKDAVGSNWHTIQIKSLTQTLPVANADAAAQDAYWKGIAATVAAYEAYANVGGVEKAAIAAAETKAAAQAAIAPFYAAKASYDALAAVIAKGKSIEMDMTEAETLLASAEATAAQVAAKAAELLHVVNLAVNTKAVEGATAENPVETSFVINGTFDTDGVIAPWKTTTNAQNQTTANNQQGAFTGNFFENWNGSAFTGKIYQEIEDIPNGNYTLKICAFVNNFDASAQYVYANADQTALTTGEPTAYEVKTIVVNNKIEIGLEQTSAVANWMGIDNVSLVYTGAVDLTELIEAYNTALAAAQAVEGDMNADVKTALNAAIAAEVDMTDADAIGAATADLTTATTAAKASVAAYIKANEILPKMKELTESTNVYTAEALDAYYGQWAVKYNEKTLTTDEANALQDPFLITGWHAAITCDNFLLSAWDTEADKFAGYYINSWSNEGNNDGSNFVVPFFEYWTNDGNSLGEKVLTGTMSGLAEGEYDVTAWVRVRTKNETGADVAAYGITLQANDGEAVDVTNGETKIALDKNNNFFLKEVTATGTVAADGVLYIKFNVAADNNISWLSFKNVKFEKKAVVPEFDENVLYSWESPEGTPIEYGGTISYENGDGNRLNYLNSGYYTICLNGKKANLNDETPSANAGHMVVTLNNAVTEGDVIAITGYITKNTSAKSSAWIVYGNGSTVESAVFGDESNIYVPDGGEATGTINTKEVIVSAEASGSKTITLTRGQTGTNLFITKLEITKGSIATGISNLNNSRNMNGTIYNLNGQKMEKMNKGLYIVNGKKVFVK